MQGSTPATPLYQADKLTLDPDYPSRKVSSNTAESRSLRSTHSDMLLSLPVFGDQVASRLQSQLSTGSRGSGRTETSLPDLEPSQPPALRTFTGRGTCLADSCLPPANHKSCGNQDQHYYYAPVFPTPSSPRSKYFDRTNHNY